MDFTNVEPTVPPRQEHDRPDPKTSCRFGKDYVLLREKKVNGITRGSLKASVERVLTRAALSR